jgi:hypothetical protein
MTRRVRGRGGWRKGAGALCVLAGAGLLFIATSCNSRFEFQGPSDGEGGDGSEASGGKFHGLGGSSGAFGSTRGGAVGNTGGNGSRNQCPKACIEAGFGCPLNSDQCVECVRRDQCSGTCSQPGNDDSALGKLEYRCIQCSNDGDCGPGESCSPDTHICVLSCSEKDASACTGGMACAEGLGYCIACRDNGGCSGETPDCPGDNSLCVECDDHQDCSNAQGKWCDPVLFACVACRNDVDCYDDEFCHPRSHVCLKK